MPLNTSRPTRLLNNAAGKIGRLTIAFLTFWLVAWGVLLLNYQNISDWWKLEHYHAPAVISNLAKEDTMTAYARRMFYLNSPAIDSAATFNKPCPNDGGEQTIVLGCYHSGESGIFLLSETDPLLNGVEQVTAAHEMLHAAYARLSSSERNYVDGLLVNYYNHDLKDPRIIQTMQAYKKTEPGQLVNEMHSVFGTEIANLPKPLEQYYTKYFTNRKVVTSYAAGYQAEFTSRQDAITQDDSILSSLKSQITSLESGLNTEQTQINNEQTELNNFQSSNQVEQYNGLVPTYNNQVDQYNSQISQVKNLINQYNSIVASRNSIALVEDQLISDLNSSRNTISAK